MNTIDYLESCILRAYRYFHHPLRGIRQTGLSYRLCGQAITEIRSRLMTLQKPGINGQEAFDDWHQAACERLCEFYQQNGFANFSIGQAPRWINMTLRYVFVLGERGGMEQNRRL